MEIGTIIASYRKERKMTQEALATALGITNQAVSKWEAGQNFPDLQLMPALADLFEISIDQLFGRSAPVEKVKCEKLDGLPWKNDDTLHAVLYVGHNLVEGCQVGNIPSAQTITLQYEGITPLNIDSYFAVSCGNVNGSVDAGTSVQCGDVSGNIDAGTSVLCGDVSGNVDAGGNITCSNVNGDINAGGDVICSVVSGNVNAGGSIYKNQ